MATDEKREHLTEDLLKRLLASASIDAYLDEGETVDQTLPSYLRNLIDAHRIKRSAVARNSGLNPTVVYDIFAGKSRPGRDHAIMLALGIGCTFRETQRLLSRTVVQGPPRRHRHLVHRAQHEPCLHRR